jgi:hypothetical protein
MRMEARTKNAHVHAYKYVHAESHRCRTYKNQGSKEIPEIPEFPGQIIVELFGQL